MPILAFATGCSALAAPATRLRLGYFPNITHAQALIGAADGTFQKALGPDTVLKPVVMNSGPSMVEALFSGEIDIAYIGPSPAITAYVRSGGAIRIVSGAASGGVRVIVQKDSGIRSAVDLRGKKLATPQLGNTQDVSARSWLKSNGLKTSDVGGEVDLVPVNNADQLTLFISHKIDASWAPEPWATRLIHEGHGQVFLDERALWPEGRFATTVIIVRKKFLDEHRPIVTAFLRAHKELTSAIKANPGIAFSKINLELKRLTGKALSDSYLEEAMSTIELTDRPMRDSVLEMANRAVSLGYLKKSKVNLADLFELGILDELTDKKATGAQPQ